MKKRLLTMMLAVMLLLVGCGNADTPDTEENTQQMETESSVTDQDEETSSATLETTETTTEIETEVQTEVETETQSESETSSEEAQAPTYTYTDLDKTMYAKSSVNVRSLPSTDGEKLGGLSKAQEVHVTGQCNETSWYRIDYNGSVAYVSNSYLVNEKPVEETPAPEEPTQPSEPVECPVDLYVIHDEGDYVYMWGYFHSYEESNSQAHIDKCEEMKNYVIGKWGYNYRGNQDCGNHVNWNGHTLCRWIWHSN